MEWVRGDSLGCGSFATVNLVIPTNCSALFPSLTAVKSSDVLTSSSLKNEKQVLDRLGFCPQIIQCFGHDYTFEDGEKYYNLFLEYASRGTLADQLKNHGRRLPESDVRRYTRTIIEGLSHIHANGFVHCDIKLQNILVFDNDIVKIADFGLAKETGKKQSKACQCRGTPLFMSPESVNDGVYEPPADIWALGCAVVEMMTGKPAWNVENGSKLNIWSLLFRIGAGEELPVIPDNLSQEGKDFLSKCFVKDPRKRWTAEMLLKHPFVADDTFSLKRCNDQTIQSTSPRSHFDFPGWISNSTVTESINSSPESDSTCLSMLSSPVDRLRRLVTDQGPTNWSESDSWTRVR